ncbi:LPXTG cell wall anchor domain-containing protein [Glaciibacter superstes]|uniref:LPXTG cell wall anchor domain-containing protein n=1 Tax=Glaciibacter superstes TaxID=501023 RepID=UPI0003B35208|nr:LPXTG cell wall anchor domain-containing protein [Glaciibacter superstes]
MRSHHHRRTLAAVIVTALAASATLVWASSAIAAEEDEWQTTAPAGEISATLTADAAGTLSLAVSNSDAVAVSADSLGITTEAAAFTTGLSVTGHTVATVDGESLDVGALSAGDYTVSVSVTDAAGRDSAVSLAFTVVGANAPGTPGDGDSGGDLAVTGVSTGWSMVIALLALAAGAVLVLMRRRAHTR